MFLPQTPVREIRLLLLLLRRLPAPSPAQTVPSPKVPHLQRVPERLVDHALMRQGRLAPARLPAERPEQLPALLPEQRQQTARPQARREPLPNRLLQHWILANWR